MVGSGEKKGKKELDPPTIERKRRKGAGERD
jgi:hypothetical protein